MERKASRVARELMSTRTAAPSEHSARGMSTGRRNLNSPADFWAPVSRENNIFSGDERCLHGHPASTNSFAIVGGRNTLRSVTPRPACSRNLEAHGY